MTKAELVKEVAAVIGSTKADAERAVNAVMRGIVRGIIREGRFAMAGVGVLKKVARNACQRSNPQRPGEKVMVPAHNTVIFKPAPDLKEAVNV